MREFCAKTSQSGEIFARINDELLYASMVDQTVICWLREGLFVDSVDVDTPVKAVDFVEPELTRVETAPGEVMWVQRKRKGARKKAKAARKMAIKKTEPQAPAPTEIDGLKVGETVYLKLDTLSSRQSIELDDYQLAAGRVAELRSGQGIRATIGVSFNGNAQVFWLRPDQLTLTQPE